MPGPSHTCQTEWVEISVVMATAGRRRLLERALDALANQDFPRDRYEVVVVVDGVKDDTGPMLEAWQREDPSRRRCAASAHRVGPAAARNRGIALARGGIVAFTDDDCVPNPGWLTALHQRFAREPQSVALIGRTVIGVGELTPFSHYVENREGHTHQTCNAAYRREVLERLRGFDPAFTFNCEDTDLYVRACQLGPVLFEPAAVVEHPPRELGFGQIVRRARNYESEFIFFRKHPRIYRERHRQCGPVWSLLYYTGIKHFARLACQHFPYAAKHPLVYLKFLAACGAERVYLLSLLPWYYWKHYPSRRASLHARAADH